MTHDHPHAEYSHRHAVSLGLAYEGDPPTHKPSLCTRNLSPTNRTLLTSVLAGMARVGYISDRGSPGAEHHELRSPEDLAVVLGLLNPDPTNSNNTWYGLGRVLQSG